MVDRWMAGTACKKNLLGSAEDVVWQFVFSLSACRHPAQYPNDGYRLLRTLFSL